MKKQLGFIGLGRMGGAMVEHLLEKRYDCVVTTDTNEKAVEKMRSLGARGTMKLDEMVGLLERPRSVWLMVPRHAVDSVLERLMPHLAKEDVVIEGGNSYYKDSMRRAQELSEKHIHFLDVGVSGGVEGARHGACMMIGGDEGVFKEHEHIFRDLCVKDGYGYMGSSGAGHRIKMIHNAVEYGMMGAIAEGMSAAESASHEHGTDLGVAARTWGHGSIIAGRLITEWLVGAWEKDPGLAGFDAAVPYGETEEEMESLEENEPMPVLTAARLMRVSSREEKHPQFRAIMGRVINALRFGFGGHTKETASKKVV